MGCGDKGIMADIANKNAQDVGDAIMRNVKLAMSVGGCPTDALTISLFGLQSALGCATGCAAALVKPFDLASLDAVLSMVRDIACEQHGFDATAPFQPSSALKGMSHG